MEVQVRMKVESLCDISTKWMEEPITGGFRRTAEGKLSQAFMYAASGNWCTYSYVLAALRHYILIAERISARL